MSKESSRPCAYSGSILRHEELLALKGHYAEMWQHQLRKEYDINESQLSCGDDVTLINADITFKAGESSRKNADVKWCRNPSGTTNQLD